MKEHSVRKIPIIKNENDLSFLIKERNKGRNISYIDLSSCIIEIAIRKATILKCFSSFIEKTKDDICINCKINCSGTFFEDDISFKNILFQEDVYFNACTFSGVADFSKSKFEKATTFEISTFEKKVYFTSCFFKDKVDYSGVEFKGHAHFAHIITRNVGCFESAKFYKNVYFDYADAEYLCFSYTSFKNILSFNNIINIKSLEIKSSNIGNKITIAETDFRKIPIKDLETITLLKNEALKSNNSIQHTVLKSKELNIYFKQLRWFKNFEEKLLMGLNKISNYNGRSWLLGIVFTLGFGGLFFSLYVMVRDGIGIHCIWTDPHYLRQAIDYFWLFNGLDGISNNSIGWGEIAFFLLGKICIGYGVYQTISAFRKYSK